MSKSVHSLPAFELQLKQQATCYVSKPVNREQRRMKEKIERAKKFEHLFVKDKTKDNKVI